MLLTFLLAASGVVIPLLAAVLATAMAVGLLLGIAPMLTGAPAGAGPARPVFLGRVPASWEYYETFGR
ncbi:hypothetical protein [Georgenia sp. SYP-B2076]|uniref:hypothetical protein n=1 Tax=Georgenia sp. SYP-B2076 TaxID=2495881 RepID=UPI000F8F6D35|nr:hypothetical protein [Georgenia sp. SYP-B2076]